MKKISLQEFCNIFNCYGCVDESGYPFISEYKPFLDYHKFNWNVKNDRGDEYNIMYADSYEELIETNNYIIEQARECNECGDYIEEVRYWSKHWEESLTTPQGDK